MLGEADYRAGLGVGSGGGVRGAYKRPRMYLDRSRKMGILNDVRVMMANKIVKSLKDETLSNGATVEMVERAWGKAASKTSIRVRVKVLGEVTADYEIFIRRIS
jgi:hypothetical protein